MQENDNDIILSEKFQPALLSKLLGIFRKTPDTSYTEFADKIPTILSNTYINSSDFLQDYLRIVDIVLKYGKTNSQLQIILHLFKTLATPAFIEHKLKNSVILSILHNSFTNLFKILDNLSEIKCYGEPEMYQLCFKQFINYYQCNIHLKSKIIEENSLNKNEELKNNHYENISKIMKRWIELGKFRHKDFYCLDSKDCFKKWIAYFNLLTDIKQHFIDTSQYDIICDVFISQLSEFLYKIFPYYPIDFREKTFGYINLCILSICPNIDEKNSISCKLIKIINKKYAKKYCLNEYYRNTYYKQNSHFSLYPFLDMLPVSSKNKEKLPKESIIENCAVGIKNKNSQSKKISKPSIFFLFFNFYKRSGFCRGKKNYYEEKRQNITRRFQ